MANHSYLFEAKSIQSYILATNRLKEIVGGSELVEGLTGSLLEDVLEAVDGEIRFSRRGGGAFYAFSTDAETIERLAMLWPLVVRQYAPDLEFVQAQGQGGTAHEAFDQAQRLLLADRNRPVMRLPQAGPFAVRSRRTGDSASGFATKKGSSDKEPVDAATRRKLDFAQGREIAARFAPDDDRDAWPLNLSPEEGEGRERNFPFTEEERTIALVHADGNGLGQLLMKLGQVAKSRPNDYVQIFHAFSAAVTDATRRAAQAATQEVLAPSRGQDGVYPARPIVLGGDDLTIIVRADLALDFTRRFLAAFAAESEKSLGKLRGEHALEQLPKQLTACAGIAYANASQPFYLLHELAEDLCKHAKRWAKHAPDCDAVPSALTFHRVTTTLLDDFETVLDRELTTGRLCQTLECYAIEPGKGLPVLDELLALQRLLNEPRMARGAARELLGLLGRAPDQAVRHYARWREVMAEKLGESLDRFDSLLKRLAQVEPTNDLPYGPAGAKGLRRSPLGDVVMLRSVGNALNNGRSLQTREVTP